MIKKLLHAALQKCKEHITVMFIPHSEKKIFNFKISYFALIFSLIVVITVTIVGTLFYYRNEQIKVKSTRINKQNIRVSTEIEIFKKITPQVKKEVKKITDVTRDLLINSFEDKNPLDLETLAKHKGGLEVTATSVNQKDLKAKKQTNEEQIGHLKDIPEQLQTTQKKLDKVKSFLKGQQKVFLNMPSVFPVIGGGYIISDFGWRLDPFTFKNTHHTGVDITGLPKSPVKATADGTIKFAQNNGDHGLYVEILHQFGFTTLYYHLASISVKSGDQIKKGQIIGTLGNTGRTSGYYLHYEIRVNDYPIDPAPFIILDKYSK